MNNYEPSEIVAIGAAHELIQGMKPPQPTMDNEQQSGFADRVLDIDETDE